MRCFEMALHSVQRMVQTKMPAKSPMSWQGLYHPPVLMPLMAASFMG